MAGSQSFARLRLAPGDGLVEINGREQGCRIGQMPYPAGHHFLGPPQGWQKDQILTVDGFLNQVSVGQSSLQRLGDDLVVHQQKLLGLILEQVHRESAVTLTSGFQQDMV